MSSNSEIVIRAENISKRYRIGVKESRKDTLFESIVAGIKAPIRNFRQIRSLSKFENGDVKNIHWALKDINFEVRRGEVLGIIGHNGAGKSTLLKILSRITEPSSGQISIQGDLSALLEVGTGFHPELSGRDNIYMNGTILGMTKKEINKKLDQIVDFSGVENYLDTPVKFYSSGMKVRLGFSVAAHLDPEILVIDEVLAVGDAEFQKKCLGKMKDVADGGRTVLFVSHDMNAVENLCHDVLLLQQGKIISRSPAKEAVKQYITGITKNEKRNSSLWPKDLGFLVIEDVSIDNQEEISLKIGDGFTIDLKYRLKEPEGRFAQIKVQVFDERYNPVSSMSNTFSENTFESLQEEGVIKVKVKNWNTNMGLFRVNLMIRKFKGEPFQAFQDILKINVITSSVPGLKRLPDTDFKYLPVSEWQLFQPEIKNPGNTHGNK